MSTRWQYQVVELKPGMFGGFKGEAVQEVLARHGQQGWELVQVVSSSPVTAMLLVFKRPA